MIESYYSWSILLINKLLIFLIWLAGNILSRLDESADPCDDMVRFSCGKWLDETEIPGSKSRWGNFDILQGLIETTLRSMITISINCRFKSIEKLYLIKI